MARKSVTPRPGSWVISRLSTGEVIGEIFDSELRDLINPKVCRIETAAEYLARLNREIRERKT